MERRRRMGWTEKGIVGFVFAPIGSFFLVMGILLYLLRAGNDPEDPMVFLFVFSGLGLLFLLLGLLFLSMDIRRRNAMRRALDSGNYVMARVSGVEQRTNVSVNGRHPCVVECRYTEPDTGTVHIWYSRQLPFNPEGLMTSEEVPVYFDRYEPENAFVDIDAILPEVDVHR